MDLRASTSAEKWLDLSLHLAIAQSERAFMREWSTLGATMGFPAISFDMAGTTRVPSFVEETKVCAKHDRRTHSHNDAMLSSLSFLSSSPRAHPFLLPHFSPYMRCVFLIAPGLFMVSRWCQGYYYESGLKCEVFGVSDLVTGKQMNYVWGEQDGPAVRGAETIVSLVHYHLMQTVSKQPIRNLYCMAGNCMAQNTNWTFVFYMCAFAHIYQVDIYYHFLLQGHTKGPHDGGFGLIKRALRKHTVHTPSQFMDVVRGSAQVNDVCDVIGAGVPLRSYRQHLSRFFKSAYAVKISKQRHFRFHADRFGVVSMRGDTSERWMDVCVLNPNITPADLPRDILDTAPLLATKSLSQKRHRQLKSIKDKFFKGVEHLKEDFYREPPPEAVAQCAPDHPSDPDIEYSVNDVAHVEVGNDTAGSDSSPGAGVPAA